MSKRSKRKENLRSSILILLLIAILLVASTYAWFTANKTVTISSLDVKVEAKNGLQISTDATTWKSIISNTDIKTGAYIGHTNQVPTVMEPVSTVGDVSAGKLQMFYGSVEANDLGNYALSATKETENAGDTGRFIAFDVFLKAEVDTQLALTANSGVVCTEGKSDKGLQNAARVAFLVEGNVPSDSAVTTITALSGATSASTYIWEPNIDVHTGDGVANARDTYGITTTQTGAAQIPYYGVKQEIAKANAVELKDTNGNDTTNFAKVTLKYSTTETFSDTNIFSLTAGITKLRIYMWVEGQDVDCENNASGSDISYNVEFSVVDTTPSP